MLNALSTFRRKWGPLSAFLFLLCCTPSAQAQRPTKLTQEHLHWHVRALDLNETQEETARQIFDSYRKEIVSLQETRWAIYSFLGESYTGEAMYGQAPEDLDEDELPISELHNRAYKIVEPRAGKLEVKVHASYFNKLLLEFINKTEVVDSLERAWRRELQFASMREFGADVDLVKLVNKKIDNPQLRKQLSEILRHWENQLDPFLLECEKSEPTARIFTQQARRDILQGKIDVDDAAEITAELPLLRARVLRLTEMTLGLLLDNLPEQEAHILKKAWHEEKYPFIWKRNDETSLIRSALRNKNLPESTHDSLDNLLVEIDQLRVNASNRLDSLQRIKLSLNAISQFHKDWYAWYADRDLPYKEQKGAKEFTAEGRKFLDAMESIAERINAITNDSK